MARVKVELVHHIVAASVDDWYTKPVRKTRLEVHSASCPVRPMSEVGYQEAGPTDFSNYLIINFIQIWLLIYSKRSISRQLYSGPDALFISVICAVMEPHGYECLG